MTGLTDYLLKAQLGAVSIFQVTLSSGNQIFLRILGKEHRSKSQSTEREREREHRWMGGRGYHGGVPVVPLIYRIIFLWQWWLQVHHKKKNISIW